MILNNPFHVLGLIANCSKREETSRGSQIKRYLEVGRPLKFENDLYFPGCRRNETTIKRAFSAIQDARDRIGPGLFWFTAGNLIDEFALNSLRSGDLLGALEAWREFEDSPAGLDYASSISNFGTISLLIALMVREPGQSIGISDSDRSALMLRGLKSKARLIGDLSGHDLSSFCASFSDGIATQDPDKIVDVFAESLDSFKEEADSRGLELTTSALLSVVDSCGHLTEVVRLRFSLSPRQELERAIRECQSAHEAEPSRAIAAGKQLIEVARVQLLELASVVSTSDFVYTSLADRVATELINAAVHYYNHRSKSDPNLARLAYSVLPLQEYALEVASGLTVRARAKDNLETTLEIIKDQEMKDVQAALLKWLEDHDEQIGNSRDSGDRIEIVQRALGRSRGASNTAISLLRAYRDQGVKTYGLSFHNSPDLVTIGTVICLELRSSVLSAYNATHEFATERRAAQMLLAISENFVAASRNHGSDVNSFPIETELAELIQSELKLIRAQLTFKRPDQDPLRTNESKGSGCFSGVALAIVSTVLLLTILALI